MEKCPQYHDKVRLQKMYLQGFHLLNYFSAHFFQPHHVTCGILVPKPGIERMPLAVEAWDLDHWMAREVPLGHFFFNGKKSIKMLTMGSEIKTID